MSEPPNFLSAMRNTLRNAEGVENDASGRTSPYLEHMIEVAVDSVTGECPPDEGLEAVKAEHNRMVMAYGSMELRAQSVEANEAVTRQLERIRTLHESYQADLSRTEAAIHSQARADIDAAAGRLRAVVTELYTCGDDFEDAVRSVEPVADAVFIVPARYGELSEAIDRVAVGKMSVSDWLAQVDAIDRELGAARQTLEISLAESGDDAYSRAQSRDAMRGVDEAAAGLARMRRFKDSAAYVDLKEGWNTLLDGLMRYQRVLESADIDPDAGGDVVRFGGDD